MGGFFNSEIARTQKGLGEHFIKCQIWMIAVGFLGLQPNLAQSSFVDIWKKILRAWGGNYTRGISVDFEKENYKVGLHKKPRFRLGFRWSRSRTVFLASLMMQIPTTLVDSIFEFPRRNTLCLTSSVRFGGHLGVIRFSSQNSRELSETWIGQSGWASIFVEQIGVLRQKLLPLIVFEAMRITYGGF